MKLSEKIANIPANELKDVIEHPEKYDLNLAEFFNFMEQAMKIKDNAEKDSHIENENQLIKMVDALKVANADLRYENERLRKAIFVLTGGESNDG